MYVYVYVCMYVCMYVFMHVYMYVCIYMYTCICICVCICICICICIYRQTPSPFLPSAHCPRHLHRRQCTGMLQRLLRKFLYVRSSKASKLLTRQGVYSTQPKRTVCLILQVSVLVKQVTCAKSVLVKQVNCVPGRGFNRSNPKRSVRLSLSPFSAWREEEWRYTEMHAPVPAFVSIRSEGVRRSGGTRRCMCRCLHS